MTTIIQHTEDYAALRATAYPPLADFADAMYWAAKGDTTKLEAYHARVEAIKQRFPKPPAAAPD
jgi:hypothetical protein